MSKTSNLPMANLVLNSTTELRGFDATDIRKLNLDEIDFVAGGDNTMGTHVSFNPFVIIRKIDRASTIFF